MSLPVPSFSSSLSAVRTPRDVCPHCKRVLTVHTFVTGEFRNTTYHCAEHGDVSPMRSAIYREGD